jgi:hypothetical protein
VINISVRQIDTRISKMFGKQSVNQSLARCALGCVAQNARAVVLVARKADQCSAIK